MQIKKKMTRIMGTVLSAVLCAVMLVTTVIPTYAYTNYGTYIDHYDDLGERPDNIEDYVTRLYRGLLDREPDASGLRSWSSALRNGKENISSIFVKFTHSTEFKTLTRNNDLRFIYAVYKTVNGNIDSLSKRDIAEWKNKLESKLWTREKVLENVMWSTELLEISAACRVELGDLGYYYTSETYTDKCERVTRLIINLYAEFLNKRGDKVDADEVEEWCRRLIAPNYAHHMSAEAVIKDFFYKGGWNNKKVSNEEFIRTVYRAVLGREVDPSGMISCTKALKSGGSREMVLRGVCRSVELSILCNDVGMLQYDGLY